MNLSKKQQAAVNAGRGGLFISAAAGSGKTRVLTARFVRLAAEGLGVQERCTDGLAGLAGVVSEARSPLDGLIAITFTDKAAGELSQRIRGTLAKEVSVEVARGAEDAWISTIHGLCSRVLHRHAFDAGVDPMFTVCDEVQAGLLRRQAFGSALAALSASDDVGWLIADYDLTDVEEGLRSVYEHLRSLGLDSSALARSRTDLPPILEGASRQLRSTLGAMLTLPDRRATEEENIARLSSLIDSLNRIDAGDAGGGLSTLAALSGFKLKKNCRACAKPLVVEAEEQAGALRRSAAGQAAERYAVGFLRLLERFWVEYASAKDALGILDFEDLQLKTRDFFRRRPDIAERYRSTLSEVMVDEFQDTNGLQLSVVKELAGGALATVGDEKQSIYGWRNADVELFRHRRSELGEARVFELPENFRSHPELVAFFNSLFAAAPFWPNALKSSVGERERSDGERSRTSWPSEVPRAQLMLLEASECVEGAKTRAEAEAVADHFETLRDAGVAQKDLVVLLRAMTRAEEFEKSLRGRGFDVYVASGGDFFDTPEAAEVEALLRTVANTRDDEAFARLLRGRMANLSEDGLYLLRAWTVDKQRDKRDEGRPRSAHGERATLWQAANDPARPPLVAEDEAALRFAASAISELRSRQGRVTLSDLIREGSELLDYDLTLISAGGDRAWANVLKFSRLAAEYERVRPSDPSMFLEYVDQRRLHQRYESQAAMAAEDVDAVRIMSVHSAKGLEFPVVALPELSRRLPTSRATFDCGLLEGRVSLGVRLPAEGHESSERDTDVSIALREWRAAREVEEAKRVLYVACTRATEALAFFSVVDSAKSLGAGTPLGWIAQASGLQPEMLSLSGAGADVCTADLPAAVADASKELTPPSFDVPVGKANVRVNLVQPAACGPGDTGATAAAGRDARRACDAATAQALVGDLAGANAVEVDARRALAGPDASGVAVSRPARISFTGLKTYLECPYRYYATYVARIGMLEAAPDPTDPRAVGRAVHRALQLVDAQGNGPSAAELESIASRLGLDDASRARVSGAVRSFLQSPIARSVLTARRVSREVSFGVDVSGTVLDGAIDLLAVFDSKAAVVDYKVGTRPITKEMREQWRLQADCYALAVFEGLDDVMALDVTFFRPEAEGSAQRFTYARDELSGLLARIEGIISRMAEGDFEPRSHYDARTCCECAALGTLCSVSPARTRA